MDEAEEILAERGVHVDLLRVRGFPFHNEVRHFINEHDQVFVVEQNRDAQLRTLLVNELEIDPARLTRVLHFDGTPITARFIATAIGDKVDELKVVPFRKAAP
jgi:2-oxoglutarate ferredoxin oxidoreductase subunit alpha